MCKNTLKCKQVNAGLSHKKNSGVHATKIVSCQSVESCRKGDASAVWNDYDAAKSYRGIADDSQQQIGIEKNRQRRAPIQIEV